MAFNGMDFKTWVDKAELKPDTVQLLADNGFDSMKSVSRLTPAVLQKYFAKSLPVGQLLMLEGAVEDLQQSKSQPAAPVTAPSSQPATASAQPVEVDNASTAGLDQHNLPGTSNPQLLQDGLDLAKLYDLFSSASPANSQSTTSASAQSAMEGKPQLFDPFQFYGMHQCVAAGDKKAKDIRDFILFSAQNQPSGSDKRSFKVGEVDVTLGLNERKVSLDKISPLQYMEATSRILRDMIINDKINMAGVLQYVGYMTKIACMGQVAPWSAILKYDTEYRKQQAALGFPWGADSPFLFNLFLNQGFAPRQKTSDGPRHSSNARSTYDPSTGQEICGKFNGRYGCSLRNCRYAHVCRSCFSHSHGEFRHRNAGTSTQPESTQINKGRPTREPKNY